MYVGFVAHADCRADLQIDLSKDSGSGIPSAVGRPEPYLQCHSVLALHQSLGNIHLKGGISIFPVADLLAVHIESGIHINSLKAKQHLLASHNSCHVMLHSRLFGAKHPFGQIHTQIIDLSVNDLELLGVPPAAVLVEILRVIDQPVVGQFHSLKSQLLAIQFSDGRIQLRQQKGPIVIKRISVVAHII